jgi:fatty acid desaturase
MIPSELPQAHPRREAAALLVDRRVRSVPWRDLVPLGPGERVWQLLLPLPWFLLGLLAAHDALWVLALAGSFYFFLTGLRLVHDTFHGNLGLRAWANDVILVVLSALMLGSMDAVRLTHLQHHRECLGGNDIEGAAARRTAAGALLWGVIFPVQLHVAALRLASPRQLRWIVAELTLTGGWIAAILISGHPVVSYHVAAMALGQTLSGFFAVWTVHHDCDRWQQIARTLRHRLKSAVSFNMFYHLEHHLYPRVPTCHLPALAERLDRMVPELVHKQVF